MTKPRLIYFDFPGSRGEECRIALHLAGVDFEDVRVPRGDWEGMKASTPYGSMPILEIPGRAALAHSNAILGLIGRKHGLHPADPFEAARHEGFMNAVEDLRGQIGPTMRISDEAQRKAAREDLAANYVPAWARHVESQLGAGPFVDGETLNVADLKLFMATRWIRSGSIDHIPASVLQGAPKLLALHDAVADHAGVQAWMNRGAKS